MITAAAGLPELAGNDAKAGPTGTGDEDTGGFKLKTTTRSVGVDLVAADKHGKPVADLKQDEITLFDNGRQQELREFFHATPGASLTPASIPVTSASDTFSNTTPAISQIQDAPDLLILLLDESHLAFLDLNRAREETLRFFATSRPTSRIALYSMSERGFNVLQEVTQDHTLVVSKLKAWTPHIQAVSQAQAQPSKPSSTAPLYTGSDSLDTSDLQGNPVGTPVALLSGNLPLRYALQNLMALARHFASVSGRKSIAWISGDSALGDWLGMKGSPQLETAIQSTTEALNEAHIVLYTVDASAQDFGAGGFDATVENPNGSAPAIQNGPVGPRLQPQSAPTQAAALGIQGPARQLAESTGGRAISKSSDLKAALDGIDRESSSYYELAFEPDIPADGKYHTLLVKVPKRKNIVLRYRTGYLYAEDSASTQQRFQQAVWSPQDATAIALTAEVMPAEAVSAADSALSKSTVKLRIAFPGLTLAQKGGRWTDQLYIFMAVRDAAQKAEVSGDTMRLNLNQATYDSGIPAGIPYQRTVDAKSKLGSVRVIVVDANSGDMGSVTLPSSALHP